MFAHSEGDETHLDDRSVIDMREYINSNSIGTSRFNDIRAFAYTLVDAKNKIKSNPT